MMKPDFFQVDQQRLATRRVPRRENQCDATISEQVCITVEQFKLLWSTQKLARESLQLIHVVVRSIWGTDPGILGSRHQNGRIREQANVADVVAMGMGYRNISDVACLKSDLRELTCYRLVQMVNDQFGQGRPALGVVQCRLRNTGVPKHPCASPCYQPAS